MDSRDLAVVIENHSRIILPDFGAFLLKDSSSIFSPENITFSPFLKYNDGVLEEYYAKLKGLTKDESAKQIKAFTDTLRESIKTKGVFIIEGIGSLSRDSKGTVVYTPVGQPQPENTGVQAVKETPKRITTNQTGINSMAEGEHSGNAQTGGRKEEQGMKPSSVENNNTGEKEVVSKPAENSIPTENVSTEPTGNPADEGILNNHKKKSKALATILYLAFSVIIALAISLVIKELVFSNSSTKNSTPKSSSDFTIPKEKENIDTSFPKDEIDSAYERMSPDDRQPDNSSNTIEQRETENKIEQSVIENAALKNQRKESYYLIVGSFKDKENALKYVNDLKAKGYNSSLVIRPNGIYSVSASSFPDRANAELKKQELVGTFPEIWIVKQ